MRKNLFLHFMNRDTREIMRVYELFGREKHSRALRRPLNVAAILCEDRCIAPPGFVLEDEISFELHEVQYAYLESGLLILPIRERSLVDYAEKKRGEYAPARSRYSGLYDDSRMHFLSSFEAAIVRRQVQIGPAIVTGFQSGVDTKSAAWKKIKETASPKIIENMRNIPTQLSADGAALTWSIIQPHLIGEGGAFHRDMRDALQYTYFREYCREFKLIALEEVPFIDATFYLPTDRAVYSYRRLKIFFDSIGVTDIFFDASSSFIIKMRSLHGFQQLIDAYVGLAALYKDDSNLSYHTSRALSKARFDWRGLASRRQGLLDDPTDVEALEIGDACIELATLLTIEHELPTRAASLGTSKSHPVSAIQRKHKLKVAIFVALEEELNVLERALSLTRNAEITAATGKFDDVDLDVLCPRAMGRVSAAVEMTRYLSQVTPRPDLIFCIGLAGGFEEAGIDHGTVICADTIVDLANRKITDQEDQAHTKFRRQDFDCSRSVYSFAKSSEFDLNAWERHCRDNFDWPHGRVPSLREGRIASVDEVISSDVQRKKMVNSEDKLLGVEMEAGGVCAAAKPFGIRVVVLRVVSDMADPAKADDVWRTRGMKSLSELIKRLPLRRVVQIATR